MNSSRTLVAARTTGHCTMSGTDWPIENYVERCVENGRVRWLATIDACNGTAGTARYFRALCEAMGYAGLSESDVIN